MIPIRTDRPLRSTPWVNYGLIAANVLVFLLTSRQVAQASLAFPEIGDWNQLGEQFPVTRYYLHPAQPHTWQFVTSIFLHGDFWHLLGNMVFLYVFGNSVEDRLGKIGYLLFYLAGGVFASLGHALFESNPVLGASGAVNAVTGAYLALFPMSRVSVLFFFIIVGFIEVPSMWLILLRFIQDSFFMVTGAGGGVAVMAHIAGSVYGFLIGMTLLWTRILPREPYDMLSMLEQRRRRAEFRALARRGYEPWEGRGAKAVAADDQAPTPAEQRLMDKRAEISRAISTKHMDRAAELYAELLDLDGDQVLSPAMQVDLANHLVASGRYELAARMYELYLNNYKTAADRAPLELMLAMLYVRYLRRGQRARELLAAATPRLTDADQQAFARQLLEQLDAGATTAP